MSIYIIQTGICSMWNLHMGNMHFAEDLCACQHMPANYVSLQGPNITKL